MTGWRPDPPTDDGVDTRTQRAEVSAAKPATDGESTAARVIDRESAPESAVDGDSGLLRGLSHFHRWIPEENPLSFRSLVRRHTSPDRKEGTFLNTFLMDVKNDDVVLGGTKATKPMVDARTREIGCGLIDRDIVPAVQPCSSDRNEPPDSTNGGGVSPLLARSTSGPSPAGMVPDSVEGCQRDD